MNEVAVTGLKRKRPHHPGHRAREPGSPWLLPVRKQKAFSLTAEVSPTVTLRPEVGRGGSRVQSLESQQRGSRLPAGASRPRALPPAPPPLGGLSHCPRGPEAAGQPVTFCRELLELVVLLQQTQVYRLFFLWHRDPPRPKPLSPVRKLDLSLGFTTAATAVTASKAGSIIETREKSNRIARGMLGYWRSAQRFLRV